MDDRLPVFVGEDARAVLVREQQLVPARQEAGRRGRVGRRQRRAREIEQLAAPLVAQGADAEALEAGREVADGDAAPLRDVGARGGPERGEVVRDGVFGGLGERRVGVVGGLVQRRAAEAVEGALRRLLEAGERDDPGVPSDLVRILRARIEPDGLHQLPARTRLLACELESAFDERVRRTLRPPGSHRRPRIAHSRVEVRQIPRRDEVQRRAHQERLDDGPPPERPLERRSLEAFDPSPEGQVGRRGELRLQSSEPLDRSHGREPLAPKEQLAQQRRPVELALRQDPLGHASTLAA